ncbi:hypothetical protein D3C71_841800 [compost metagenome]
MAGQLAAFAGLGALRHLDLDLVGGRQVLGGHAETARRHLLDLRAQRVALLEFDVGFDAVRAQHRGQRVAVLDGALAFAHFGAVAQFVLAAFAGVGLAADAVHGHGQHGVGFGRDRTQRHGAGGEALDDVLGRLDVVQRNGARRIETELEQAAQGHVATALVVDDLRVFLVRAVVVGARSVLQLGDGIRRPHVLFAADAVGILATRIQVIGQHRVGAERGAVLAQRFFGDLEDADAFDVGRGAGEVLVHQAALQADGFEDLRAGVGHVGRDAHLGHDLVQALADGLDEVLHGLFGVIHLAQRFQRQVGVNGFGAVAAQKREVVDFARRAGFHDEARVGAQAGADQVLVNGGGGQQRGDGHALAVDQAVGHDQDVVAALHRIHGARAQRGHAGFDALGAPGGGVRDVQFEAAEFLARHLFDVADLRHGGEVQHRLGDFQAQRRIDVVDVQQVRLGADEGHQRHHELFADGVDRRVGDLREQLAEVVVERLGAVGQHGQRGVVAHRTDDFLARGGHGFQDELEVFLGPAEGLLAVQQGHGRLRGHGDLARRGQRFQLDLQAFDPLAVRPAVRKLQLDLGVVDDAALFQVDQEHLARLQAPLLDDAVFGDRQRAGFGRQDDHVVIGDQVAGRAQAVAVQRGADLAAIGERDRGGAVPRLHHGGVVFVEGAAALVHLRVLFPGFRDHHHHGVGQRIARVHQQFQAVVERRGIRLAFVDDRVQLFQVVAQHG